MTKPKGEPRVTVSLQLNFKDSPIEYRGIIQENWVFGKDQRGSLTSLLSLVAKTIIVFYLMCFRPMKQSDLDQHLDVVCQRIQTYKHFENRR